MSLHLVKSGRSRVVACSDNIGCFESGPPSTEVQKLFQTGRWTLCGMAGITEAGPGDPIANRIHGLSTTIDLGDSPRRFLSALRDELTPRFAQLFAEDCSRFQWLLPDTEVLFVAFSLKRDRTGTIDLLELRFPLHEANAKPALGNPEIVPHLEGVLPGGPIVYNLSPAPVRNDLLGRLNPDAGDDIILAGIDKAVEGIRSASDLVRAESTARMDVAAIDAEGVRWLRKFSTAQTITTDG
jgi:hypothetical protein